jgi:hypothetical protein
MFVIALVGFEGEGQSFQFCTTFRLGGMRYARCKIFLRKLARELFKEIKSQRRIAC